MESISIFLNKLNKTFTPVLIDVTTEQINLYEQGKLYCGIDKGNGNIIIARCNNKKITRILTSELIGKQGYRPTKKGGAILTTRGMGTMEDVEKVGDAFFLPVRFGRSLFLDNRFSLEKIRDISLESFTYISPTFDIVIFTVGVLEGQFVCNFCQKFSPFKQKDIPAISKTAKATGIKSLFDTKQGFKVLQDIRGLRLHIPITYVLYNYLFKNGGLSVTLCNKNSRKKWLNSAKYYLIFNLKRDVRKGTY